MHDDDEDDNDNNDNDDDDHDGVGQVMMMLIATLVRVANMQTERKNLSKQNSINHNMSAATTKA